MTKYYNGPSNTNIVDAHILSRILYLISSKLSNPTKICLLGGSALTILGIREGSDDIDCMVLEGNSTEIVNAVRTIQKTYRERNTTISVKTGNKISSIRIPWTVVQVLTHELSSCIVPLSFNKRCEEVKYLQWVKPKNAEIITVGTSVILSSKLKIYLPNTIDLICMKLFARREKDLADAYNLLKQENNNHKFLIKQIFEEYIITTEKKRTKYEKNLVHAVTYYNYFSKEFQLLPLENTINEKYLSK